MTPLTVPCETPSCRNHTAEGFCTPCQETQRRNSDPAQCEPRPFGARVPTPEEKGDLPNYTRHLDPEQGLDLDRAQDHEPLHDSLSEREGLGLGVTSRTIEEFAELRAAFSSGGLQP